MISQAQRPKPTLVRQGRCGSSLTRSMSMSSPCRHQSYLLFRLSKILLHLVTKPIYSAAMLAQHVIALQTELHRPKPL